MSDPNTRLPISDAPLSVLLFVRALSMETEASLSRWRAHLDSLKRAYEILLIHETRPEVGETPALSVAQSFPYVRADGFRAAVNDAIRSTRHPLLVFCVFDNQYAPEDLTSLMKEINKVDLAIGYRLGGQAPFWRVLLDLLVNLSGRIFVGLPMSPRLTWLGGRGWGRRLVARWIFGLRVTDPECMFLVARRTLFERMPIQSGGAFLPVEILAKANHLMCLLTEAPVRWTPPTEETAGAISFGADARQVFRSPDFGPYPPRPLNAEPMTPAVETTAELPKTEIPT